MGAVIGVGLAGLFGLMGLVALVSWIDSTTKANPILEKGDREIPNAIDRPDFKDGLDAIKETTSEKADNMGELYFPEQIVRKYDVTNARDLARLSWEETMKLGLAKVQDGTISSLEELYESWQDAQRYNTPIPEGYAGTGQNTTVLNPAISDYNDMTNEKPYITDIPRVEEGTISGESDEEKVIEGIVSGEEKVDGVIAGESGNPQGEGGAVVVPETEIKDGTNDGLEEFIDGIDMQSVLDLIDKNHREQRAYEEKIRKETQEREDNAYQRAVADMRKAGINPNLVNLVQSASGGGIVQPTPKDYTLWQTEINKTLSMIQQQIELNFKGEQADKDRLVKAITSMMGLVAIGARMK